MIYVLTTGGFVIAVSNAACGDFTAICKGHPAGNANNTSYHVTTDHLEAEPTWQDSVRANP